LSSCKEEGGKTPAAAAAKRRGGWRSCGDHHAGHEDVVVEGGAGGPRGRAARVVLGFLFQLDLLVPAIGAAECLLATATPQPKLLRITV